MANPERSQRREEIRRLLSDRKVETQEHLAALLRKAGYEVTQATLSRDLAQLGARRTSLPDGGTAYELNAGYDSVPADAFSTYRELVRSIEASDAMVVVRTLPGAASAVATGIDSKRVDGVLGTLAGDDTIFIATSKGHRPSKVARQLASLLGKELN